jgi:hypothetical protein
MIAPVPDNWFIPTAKDGTPILPLVRQLLYDLSLIGRSPEVYGLSLEVDTLEQLFRLLASPEGRSATNCWAVREWIDRSGEMGETSDHAPDELIDIYEEMAWIDDFEASQEAGTTPEQLLERLRLFRLREKSLGES